MQSQACARLQREDRQDARIGEDAAVPQASRPAIQEVADKLPHRRASRPWRKEARIAVAELRQCSRESRACYRDVERLDRATRRGWGSLAHVVRAVIMQLPYATPHGKRSPR